MLSSIVNMDHTKDQECGVQVQVPRSLGSGPEADWYSSLPVMQTQAYTTVHLLLEVILKFYTISMSHK